MAVAERRTAACWEDARGGEEVGAEVDTDLCATIETNKKTGVRIFKNFNTEKGKENLFMLHIYAKDIQYMSV